MVASRGNKSQARSLELTEVPPFDKVDGWQGTGRAAKVACSLALDIESIMSWSRGAVPARYPVFTSAPEHGSWMEVSPPSKGFRSSPFGDAGTYSMNELAERKSHSLSLFSRGPLEIDAQVQCPRARLNKVPLPGLQVAKYCYSLVPVTGRMTRGVQWKPEGRWERQGRAVRYQVGTHVSSGLLAAPLALRAFVRLPKHRNEPSSVPPSRSPVPVPRGQAFMLPANFSGLISAEHVGIGY
ncbi:hypothetical protein G7046_g7846 [Stylonectria norvegica]|nr:hypothetical protein G7046_g7846 [Stylonectria norvegica]